MRCVMTHSQTNKHCNVQALSHKVKSMYLEVIGVLLLRSQSPSGICAKLRTVAASNNRVHAPQSFYYCLYCLFTPRTHFAVLRAHPVRGESHIQRNATREVATLYYNRHDGVIHACVLIACISSKYNKCISAIKCRPILSTNAMQRW